MLGNQIAAVSCEELRWNWKRVSFTRCVVRIEVSVTIRFWPLLLLLYASVVGEARVLCMV